MATEERRSRIRIDDWSGVTTSVVIPDGQERWYDGVTGYQATEIIRLVGDGSTTIASLLKRQELTDGAQTLYGVKTFDSIPVLPSTAPTSDNQSISKVHAEALLGLPAGYLYGLETSADTDTDHDVLITVGKCRDYDDTADLELSTAITKRIDATWAAGDDAGGMFTGAVAVDTTYHLFVIMKDSDASIDAGWDANIDCANIPTGYTAYRRMRSYMTDASANILKTYQRNDYFLYDIAIEDFLETTVSTTATAITISVPADIKPIARMSGTVYNSDTTYIRIGSTDMDGSVMATVMRTHLDARPAAGVFDIEADASSQIYYLSTDGVLSANLSFTTHGWIDDRGQHGGK